MSCSRLLGGVVALLVVAVVLVPGSSAAEPVVEGGPGYRIVRVSVSSEGEQANARAGAGFSSADGRLVGFNSEASNLVEGDENGLIDAFVHDLDTGVTTREGVSDLVRQPRKNVLGGVISGDGSKLLVVTEAALLPVDTNQDSDIYLRDLETGVTELVTVGFDGGPASAPTGLRGSDVSFDGSVVAFGSTSTNLVEGVDDGSEQIYVRDLTTGTTSHVSVLGDEIAVRSQLVFSGGGLDAEGGRVFFSANFESFGLPEDSFPFAHDRATGMTERIDAGVYSEDRTTIIGVGPFDYPMTDLTTGQQWFPATGPDGRQFFINNVSLSANGRYLAFTTQSPALGNTNGVDEVVRFDRVTGERIRVLGVGGAEPDGRTSTARISADGSTIAFSSDATNLVEGDTNGVRDVFAVIFEESSRSCDGVDASIVGSGSIVGTDGDDVIVGSEGPDRIDGAGGDDLICGLSGDDIVLGGPGDDRLIGGPGADQLGGGPGYDTVDYSTRPLTDGLGGVRVSIDGQPDDGRRGEGDNVRLGIEAIIGTSRSDILIGSAGDNVIDAGVGNDHINARGGADIVFGGDGGDIIVGDDGDDRLDGGPGDDVIRGGDGADMIDAGPGRDFIIGGPDNDTLIGGPDPDRCRGSAGTDTYFGCETAAP